MERTAGRNGKNITPIREETQYENLTKILALVLVACTLMCLVVSCGGKKPVLLAVSFGSSYNETRDATIGAVENALKAAYPNYEVCRAFTSQIVVDILEEREKMEIDNMTEALDRLVADGVKEVVVQPTHVITGFEYDDVLAEVAKYESKFDSLFFFCFLHCE